MIAGGALPGAPLPALHAEPRQPSDQTEPQQLATIWNGVREELRGTLPPSAFENWLEPLRAVGIQGTRLYVSGPDRVRDWFQRRYGAAAIAAMTAAVPQRRRFPPGSHPASISTTS
jgi:DnaA-like protein